MHWSVGCWESCNCFESVSHDIWLPSLNFFALCHFDAKWVASWKYNWVTCGGSTNLGSISLQFCAYSDLCNQIIGRLPVRLHWHKSTPLDNHVQIKQIICLFYRQDFTALSMLLWQSDFSLPSKFTWGAFQKHLWALKYSHGNKIHIFQCMGKWVWVKYLVWNFKGALWNSTQNILPIHWKTWCWYNIGILRALKFKSSYVFLKCPPGYRCIWIWWLCPLSYPQRVWKHFPSCVETTSSPQ